MLGWMVGWQSYWRSGDEAVTRPFCRSFPKTCGKELRSDTIRQFSCVRLVKRVQIRALTRLYNRSFAESHRKSILLCCPSPYWRSLPNLWEPGLVGWSTKDENQSAADFSIQTRLKGMETRMTNGRKV